jgi:hypothetical protein
MNTAGIGQLVGKAQPGGAIVHPPTGPSLVDLTQHPTAVGLMMEAFLVGGPQLSSGLPQQQGHMRIGPALSI